MRSRVLRMGGLVEERTVGAVDGLAGGDHQALARLACASRKRGI